MGEYSGSAKAHQTFVHSSVTIPEVPILSYFGAHFYYPPDDGIFPSSFPFLCDASHRITERKLQELQLPAPLEKQR